MQKCCCFCCCVFRSTGIAKKSNWMNESTELNRIEWNERPTDRPIDRPSDRERKNQQRQRRNDNNKTDLVNRIFSSWKYDVFFFVVFVFVGFSSFFFYFCFFFLAFFYYSLMSNMHRQAFRYAVVIYRCQSHMIVLICFLCLAHSAEQSIAVRWAIHTLMLTDTHIHTSTQTQSDRHTVTHSLTDTIMNAHLIVSKICDLKIFQNSTFFSVLGTLNAEWDYITISRVRISRMTLNKTKNTILEFFFQIDNAVELFA